MLLKRQIEESSESGAHSEAAEGSHHCSLLPVPMAHTHENAYIQLVPKLLTRNL